MAGINECNADQDGKRAALDLAKSRPEDFSAQCWNIDNKLKGASLDYTRAFMNSMDSELESRHLLPKVELNMIAQADNSALQPLQDPHKHIDTQDLLRAQDEYRSNGRNVERNLVDGLMHHQQDIQDTHAERNFWGKNHGGIDINRVNRWAEQNPADLYGAQDDVRNSRSNQNFGPGGMNNQNDGSNSTSADSHKSASPDGRIPGRADGHKDAQDKPTDYDNKQDDQIRALRDQLAQEKQARQLKATVEAGVIKDAHHTVQNGETLRDMACLALHKAGQVHMSEGMIKHEEAKIRMVNGLTAGEQLRAGTSLMLRTREEVDHETSRRLAAYDHHQHSSQSMLNNFSINYDNHGSNHSQQFRSSYSRTHDYADRARDDDDSNTRPYRQSTTSSEGWVKF